MLDECQRASAPLIIDHFNVPLPEVIQVQAAQSASNDCYRPHQQILSRLGRSLMSGRPRGQWAVGPGALTSLPIMTRFQPRWRKPPITPLNVRESGDSGGAGNRTRVRAGFFRTSTCVAALSLLGPNASCGTASGGPATVSFSSRSRDRSAW